MNVRTLLAPLLIASLCAAALAPRAHAADEGVYGPVAPPGSAFIRVFNATAQGELEGRVGDKVLSDIASFNASEFVFLPAGKYTLSIAGVNQDVTLKPDRYYTAALKGREIKLLENDRFANRLKALVVVYNLVDGGALSLKTQDGRPVVENVGANTFGQREVNAVRANLALFEGDKKVAEVKPMNLERGRAFSLFVAGSREQPVTAWVVN
jgi:alginate O-acetyltransferase complex protein AlgF